MLKDMRQNDPMLAKLVGILQDKQTGGYSKETIKSYTWHAAAYQNYCDDKNTTPQEANQELLEAYLKSLNEQVKKKEKSRPFFLQACSSLEILYRGVFKKAPLARAVPRIRKKLSI